MELYTLDRDLTVDEGVVYKGQLTVGTLHPAEKSQTWLKMYMLCKSESGYVLSALICTGKGTKLDKAYKDLQVPLQVLMTCLKPYLTTGNFFSSPQLADILISHRTHTYETMKITRKKCLQLSKQKI
jgi:hypothetical protein